MSGSPDPIVLLHGLAVDHRMWILQRDALQTLGPVYAPDLPGFGSEPPLPLRDCTPEGYADWIATRLLAQGLSRCRLVGYSMGGTLALVVALRHPALVSCLAAACASPCWAKGWRGPVAEAAFGLAGRLSVEAFRQSILWGFARSGKDPAYKPEVEDMAQRAHGPTMLALCRALAHADYRPDLASVRVPTLVVGGTWDHLAPPSHLRDLAAGVPQATLRVLQRATHLLCLFRADEFSGILVEFLGSCLSG